MGNHLLQCIMSAENIYLVFLLMFALEEHDDSSPFFTVWAVFEDQVGNGVGKSGACAAVLDVMFLEPFVWEFSPFSLFDWFNHGVDIDFEVLVDDIELLENAWGIAKLSLHFLLFRFQFFSKTISKLKNVISCTFLKKFKIQMISILVNIWDSFKIHNC